MIAKKYKVLKCKRASEPVEVGQIVFQATVNDYGLAAEDTRNYGIDYISVTKVEGEYPFFTIPFVDLEEIAD